MEKPTHQSPEKTQDHWNGSPKHLLALPSKKALEVIIESPTPASLVQSLAEEDLFWLVKDIGPEDALPILSLASNDQWQYLLDLELWQKDRLQIDSVNQWLSLLLNADPERFLIWGLREHVELLELNLFKNIEVRIKEKNESSSDFDDTYFTLDGVFYIRMKDNRYYETIRQFLEHLAGHDRNKFHAVLLELAGVLPAELEEDMYRLRNLRLAEKGFLPFDEAIGIYQYRSPQSLAETEPCTQKLTHGLRQGQIVPVSVSLLMKKPSLLYMSLQQIQEGHVLEQLQMELAGMCNQIVSADGFRIREKEDLEAVVRKTCGYLSIGLEKATGGDQHQATNILKTQPLQHIFQAGYSTALDLKWKATKWLRQSWFDTMGFDLSFWEDKWEKMLEGLLRKRPLFHTGYTATSKGEAFREFETLEEITHCHEALDEIIALDHLLHLLFADTLIAQKVQAYEPLTFKSLLLTSWARHCLRLSEQIKPLQPKDMKVFFADLWAKGAMPHSVEEETKQSFLDWLASKSGASVADIVDELGEAFYRLFEELEEEYGSISLKDLDPRYVRHLLMIR